MKHPLSTKDTRLILLAVEHELDDDPQAMSHGWVAFRLPDGVNHLPREVEAYGFTWHLAGYVTDLGGGPDQVTYERVDIMTLPFTGTKKGGAA
jgi:hypothetical protein